MATFTPVLGLFGGIRISCPNQCVYKIVYLESYMRNGLDRLGIGRIWIESHPLYAKWTGLKSRDMNM